MNCLDYKIPMLNLLKLRKVFLFLIISSIIFTLIDLQANETTVWEKLKSDNHFALMRHSIAPGTGDPANFELGKCATQRNLSIQGREQAVAIGEAFRTNEITNANVFSSQWCRCLETAKLLNLGQVNELPALNSFFQQRHQEAEKTEAIQQWLATQNLSEVIVLVTHQVNITALTGVYPSSGEVIIVKRLEAGELQVIDRFEVE